MRQLPQRPPQPGLGNVERRKTPCGRHRQAEAALEPASIDVADVALAARDRGVDRRRGVQLAVGNMARQRVPPALGRLGQADHETVRADRTRQARIAMAVDHGQRHHDRICFGLRGGDRGLEGRRAVGLVVDLVDPGAGVGTYDPWKPEAPFS
ncbi:hypothetical protein [Massilia sp. 9096]|uniref:hypothetical protein n=1 Tax=Massilia sp. 9096 TaxID=1500894 RepID=UPI001EFA5F5D|nr:hypothetical protein [Massilia sp. 9096]